MTTNPADLTMKEEIFGPVLVIFVYPDNKVQEALELAKDNKYALTGAVFAQDRQDILVYNNHYFFS